MSNLPGEDLALCPTCGTQYDTTLDSPPSKCTICEDPRQYVPASGQTWTSLRKERGNHKNQWKQDDADERLWSIYTDPKLGIGERAMLIKTPHGNVLWDCFAYLGDETIEFINSQGGLKAIVISHPHFYTTHLDWASTFDCPVYTHADDKAYLMRADPNKQRRLITSETETILPGVTAIQIGGHFDGQICLHYDGHLFHADGFVNVPSSFTPDVNRPEGMTTFSFMWSIPNMIPLSPDEIMRIWNALKGYEFEATHGLFVGWDVRKKNVKQRMLDSMKVQVRRMGYQDHGLLNESVMSR